MLPRPSAKLAAPAAVGLGLAAAPLLAYSIGKTESFPLLLMPVVLGLAYLAARRHARATVVLGTFVMALPYTWSPQVPKLGMGFGILVGFGLLLASFPLARQFRLTMLDIAVVLLAVTPAPVSYFQGQGFHLTLWLAPAALFPYFGFRLFFHSTGSRSAFVPAVVIAGIATTAIALVETGTGRNPILAPQPFSAMWDSPLRRNGILRAASTFGHPLAFGMFLLIPLAYVASRRGRLYVALTLLFLAGELVTLSRGPWIGASLIMLFVSRWNRRRLFAIAILALAAVVAIHPLRSLIFQSGGASTESGQTASYRVGLLSGAFKHLTPLGHPNTDIQHLIPGFADVTSWLADTILSTGFAGLCELLLVVGLAIRLIVISHRDGDADFIGSGAAVAGQLAGLVTVTLITSYQFFWWASLAYLVATSEDAFRRRAALTAQTGASPAVPRRVRPTAVPLAD